MCEKIVEKFKNKYFTYNIIRVRSTGTIVIDNLNCKISSLISRFDIKVN